MPYKIHVHRTQVDAGRVTFDWALIHDPRLSAKAAGELLRLLTEPPGEEPGKGGAPKRRGDGRDGVQAVRREWENAGYLRRERVNGKRGRIVEILHIYDYPQVAPETGFPASVPPGQTAITAGRTDDGFPGAGRAVSASSQVAPMTGFPATVKDDVSSPQAAPATGYPAPVNPLPAPTGETHIVAGRTDDGFPGIYLDLNLDREIDRSGDLPPGTPQQLLSRVEPGVSAEIVGEVMAIIRDDRRATVPAGLLYHLIGKGEGPALITEAKKRLAARSTPTPPPRADQCGLCSRTGHDADNCPDRLQPAARPALTATETPCAAGGKCRQRSTPVPDGQDYHETCQMLGGLRVASSQPRSADREEVGRRIAAEQLAEMRPAGQDGGHAA